MLCFSPRDEAHDTTRGDYEDDDDDNCANFEMNLMVQWQGVSARGFSNSHSFKPMVHLIGLKCDQREDNIDYTRHPQRGGHIPPPTDGNSNECVSKAEVSLSYKLNVHVT